MERFWIEELRTKCNEIAEEGINAKQISRVSEAHDRIIDFSNIGRKEGILALEEASTELDMNDDAQSLFFKLMSLVVDGTEPSVVMDIAANIIVANSPNSYEGLMSLMYIKGTLMIQRGDNPYIIQEMIRSMMPKNILDELNRRECENALPKALEKVETEQERIASLCKDGDEIDELDHSIVAETAKSLIMLTDKDAQRFLRDADTHNIALAMKGLPGKARARIFNNLSPRLAVMIADDMEFMGPVRMKDVEKCCVKLMKILLKLENQAEIAEYDFAVLKVVIDMYDSAERENQVLREKYKELHSIINKIYNY